MFATTTLLKICMVVYVMALRLSRIFNYIICIYWYIILYIRFLIRLIFLCYSCFSSITFLCFIVDLLLNLCWCSQKINFLFLNGYNIRQYSNVIYSARLLCLLNVQIRKITHDWLPNIPVGNLIWYNFQIWIYMLDNGCSYLILPKWFLRFSYYAYKYINIYL